LIAVVRLTINCRSQWRTFEWWWRLKTACLYSQYEVEFPGWCNPGARTL